MINRTHFQILAGFLAAGVDFVVVGGIAVNAYGYVRATHDLDLFIRPTEANAQAAYDALLAAGVPLTDHGPMDLLDDHENLRFGPDEEHVDILSSIGTLPFDQVWRNRVEASLEGLKVPFISKADLMENKRQVGRLRDLADVEELALLPDVEPAVPVQPEPPDDSQGTLFGES